MLNVSFILLLPCSLCYGEDTKYVNRIEIYLVFFSIQKQNKIMHKQYKQMLWNNVLMFTFEGVMIFLPAKYPSAARAKRGRIWVFKGRNIITPDKK